MTLGGRAAEEIVFGEITTGASNDLEKVTATAKQMVMRFGMSEKLGPRVFGHDHGQPFLGREFSAEPDYSDEIAREIDDEIRRIVEAAHVQAKEILSSHRDSLEKLSEILIKRETIEKEQFEALLTVRPRRTCSAPRRRRRPRSRSRRPRPPSGRRAKGRGHCLGRGWPGAPPSKASRPAASACLRALCCQFGVVGLSGARHDEAVGASPASVAPRRSLKHVRGAFSPAIGGSSPTALTARPPGLLLRGGAELPVVLRRRHRGVQAVRVALAQARGQGRPRR